MLENIGLGGVLTFDGNAAVAGMNQASNATNLFAQSQDRAKTSTASLGSAMQNTASVFKLSGLALLPLSAAFGVGLHMAANFEHQMDAVGAITRANATDMQLLENKAKHMAVVTTFTATEAGQAMEAMGRAGASTKEIMDGLSGVMATAASGAIPLQTSAEIISQVVRGMGLDFGQASRVADVMSLTSSKANTDITSLGEAFKYAQTEARTLGIPLETVAGFLGAAADAGLKGSVGGSSFAAMLVKLVKPSKGAAEWLAKNNIQMHLLADGSLNVVDVMHQVVGAMDKETNVVTKAAAASELFGVRGQKAFSAIEASMKAGRLEPLIESLLNAQGVAETMAKRRLSNFSGQMHLLMSSVEIFAIETAGKMLEPMTANLTMMADALGGVAEILGDLNQGGKRSAELQKQYGETIYAVAVGIKEGMDLVIATFHALRDVFLSAIQSVTGSAGPEMVAMITKWITVFFVFGAVVAPVLLMIGTAISLFASLGSAIAIVATTGAPVFAAIGTAIGGVVANLLVVGLVAAAVFALLRNENESFGQSVSRIWEGFKNLVMWVYETAIKPFADSFMEQIWPSLQSLWANVQIFLAGFKQEFRQLIGGIIMGFEFLKPVFMAVFGTLGKTIGNIVGFAIDMFGKLLGAIHPILTAVKNIGLFIVEFVVNALLKLAQMIVKVADSVGASGFIEEGLRKFAAQDNFKITDMMAEKTTASIGIVPPDVAASRAAAAAAKGAADNKGEAAKPPNVDVNVNLEDKRKLDITNCMTVDGRALSVATAKHKQEINERAGFKATPWQRRTILEQGAAPVGGLGGSP